MGGLSSALENFNKSRATHEEPDGDEGKETPSETSEHGKFHSAHVHKEKDGTHHLNVHYDHEKHGHHVVHSEHASMEEAAEEMKKHG